jgi:hypothetical protein
MIVVIGFGVWPCPLESSAHTRRLRVGDRDAFLHDEHGDVLPVNAGLPRRSDDEGCLSRTSAQERHLQLRRRLTRGERWTGADSDGQRALSHASRAS